MKIEKINDHQIRCTLTNEDLATRHLKLSELAYGSEKAKDLFRDMMIQAQNEVGFEADNIPLMIEAIPITPDSIVLIITKVEDPEELDTRFSKFAHGMEDIPAAAPEAPQISGADDILDLFHQLCENALSKKEDPAPQSKDEKADEKQPQAEKASSAADNGNSPKKEIPPELTRIFQFRSLDTVIQAALGLNGCYHGKNTLYKDRKDQYLLILHQSDTTPEEFNKVCNILSEYGTGKACSAAGEAFLNEHGQILIASDAMQKLLQLS